MDKDRKDDDPWEEIFGFTPDELFQDFEKMFEELFSQMNEQSEGDEPAVWGFSMTQRPGEAPEFNSFGNMGQNRDGSTPGGEEGPEPLVDTFKTESEVQVVAELPGADEEDVRVTTEGTELRLRAETELGRYDERVELPEGVALDTLEKRFNNGVLQVTLGKKQ